jgi:hypothetical protein
MAPVIAQTTFRADQIRVPWRTGSGTYTAAWPFDSTVGTPTNFSIIRGTLATPAASTVPVLSIVNRATGDLAANAGEFVVQSLRTSGAAVAVAASATPQTVGFGATALSGHVLMERGTGSGAGQYASGFPLWLTCQLWSDYDNCSNEINIVNASGADAPGTGGYVPNGLTNGLAIIAAPNGATASKVSSAIYIGTQDTTWAQIRRGIDFQQNAIANYAILLPYGQPGGIWAKNLATEAPVAMLWLGGGGIDTVSGTGGDWFWVNSGGTSVASMTAAGLLSVTGVTPGPTGFASLATCATGIRGQMRTVLDSTTVVWGATITGGGADTVLAFCNGASWTVAGK